MPRQDYYIASTLRRRQQRQPPVKANALDAVGKACIQYHPACRKSEGVPFWVICQASHSTSDLLLFTGTARLVLCHTDSSVVPQHLLLHFYCQGVQVPQGPQSSLDPSMQGLDLSGFPIGACLCRDVSYAFSILQATTRQLPAYAAM